MACKYYYKNLKTFNSELELDNFLISNENALKLYGDIVFERKTVLNTMLSELHKTHTEEVKRLQELGKAYRLKHIPKFGFDDIDYGDDTDAYIGVTRMLQDIRIEKNGKMHRLFPEFMEEDFEEDGVKKQGFWSHKFEQWGKVTDLKSLSEDDKECLFDKNDSGEYQYVPLTKEVMERAKVRYKNKWKFQRIQGIAIHEMFNLFYSGDETKTSLRRYSKLALDDVEKKLRKKLLDVKITVSEEGEPYKEENFFDIITDDVYKSMFLNIILFNDLLVKICGYDCICLPEFNITSTAINSSGVEVPVIGRVDLLVIDDKGNLQFFDYKVSPKEYGNVEDGYDSAKVRTFRYQFATYKRIMQRAGTPINHRTHTYIVPLQMKDLHLNSDETWSYNWVSPYHSVVEDLTSSLSSNDIETNILKFLPFDHKLAIKDTGDVLVKTDEAMRSCFPVFRDFKDNSLESIEKELKERKRNPLEKKAASGKYETTFYGKEISADSPEELIKKCKEHVDIIANSEHDTFNQVKRSLSEAQERNVKNLYRYEGRVSTRGNTVTERWIDKYLGLYANLNYEILDSESFPALKQLDALGIIVILNKITKVIDFVKVSNKRLFETIKLNGQRNLLGNFYSDLMMSIQPKELTLESTLGNMELMEIMFALNNIPSLFDNSQGIVGNISVLNPYLQNRITTSNKQLLYNFSKLMQVANLGENNFSINGESNKILMASHAELVRLRFNEILADVEDSNGYSGKLNSIKNFQSMVSEWDSFIGNPVILRTKLKALSDLLEKDFGFKSPSKDAESTPEYKIYLDILTTIAEIDGFDFKQLIKGHDSYLEHMNVLRNGWSGSELDNPGNLENETLNVVAKANNIAYQNTRDDIANFMSKFQPLLLKLKLEKQQTWIGRNLTEGSAKLFENMTRVIGEEGHQELEFVDPDDSPLTDTEKEFLRFTLKVINEQRGYTPEDDRYFRVPLQLGNFDSQVLTKSWIGAIKEKFKNLNPKVAYAKAKEKLFGLLTDDVKESINTGNHWEMTNNFDAGEDDYVREKMLNDAEKGGVSRFDRNLETLLLSHVFAYSLLKNMNSMFPTMKAAMMHLLTSRMDRNQSDVDFNDDIDYFEKYLTAKIFNQSIVKEKYRPLQVGANELMSIASKLALGLNPHLFYQCLDGIFKDTSLIFRNYLGGNIPYTKQNMVDSFFSVYRDLVTSEPSVNSLINLLYGINDMDMNSYVNKIKSEQGGVFNFDNVLFKFASRPDFYNRMTMFGSHMRADGCWDAHSVENGVLVYDWTKDSRFNIYAKNPTGNGLSGKDKEEFNKQKALYVAMSRQFMSEHVLNKDGTEFEISDFNNPIPLPKAYTTQQSEAIKAETDKIYGYYSHEKKSLFLSTLVGSMLMQMNTYWSSKKNQYLGKTGINLQGKMEQYVEAARNDDGSIKKDADGKVIYEKWYEEIDDDGNPTGNYVPKSKVTESMKVIPFMTWRGQFEEGIVVTLTKIVEQIFIGDLDGKKGWNAMMQNIWNNDDKSLRQMYRNNLGQLFHDLFMMFFMGHLVVPILTGAANDHAKKTGNKTIGDAFANTCLLEAVNMTRASIDDFNFVKSIGNRGLNWTAFSIESINRQIDTFGRVMTGSTDFFDAVVKTNAATRTTLPIWDHVKLETMGRKIGDNGKRE